MIQGPDTIELIIQMLLAVAIGSALGYERERIGKAAGMRTYALVCLGSLLFTILSMYGFDNAAGDTSRIASQIVIGIGFIGGGLIMHQKEHITGLTTAAGLWATAAIGMALGVGWYSAAIAAAVIVFLVLISSRTITVKSVNGSTKK